ncbi:CCCH zinc finger protein [Cordyceps fumosorosea ARSEF 2679]|uniref:CCCH zinc finger protein n=1 Tax=Cordyceps fumosorosea (strain ARSEF 2679) TaxID=1081104 RepID=A0A168E0F8_CORFA|nr:CCCH zinc finger protein [Cordyceps fumosorosea ARSEF 2679]OAA73228.1 CCCH zinc finger protein [Cordyceps fumosorosea ARSEF 2679]
MSGEERELLDRISALAGQINRHKNQQAGFQPSHGSRGYRQQNPRYRGTSYRGRGFRVGRPPVVHRHRTLNLNAQPSSSDSSPSTPISSTDNAQWVSKTDRHKQLINANIYQQQAESRAQAIEETRQRRLTQQKSSERTRFNNFLRHNHDGTTQNTGQAEIVIANIRFLVRDGGKKLVRAADNSSDAPPTPKSTAVAGVRFHRTKTGNLVANRVIKEQRRSGAVKKVDELCKIFSTTGSCRKGPSCRYQHDPTKVAICKDFLKEGRCVYGENCDLSHELTPERVPNCLHFAKGNCSNANCQYSHSAAPHSAPVCEAFGYRGYCEKGAECTERHVFECPAFSNTGTCKTKGCKLLHRERASVLRHRVWQEQDETMEDVSSDEEPADSDDVDSDDVAEFLAADEDDSDFEHAKDFIPL